MNKSVILSAFLALLGSPLAMAQSLSFELRNEQVVNGRFEADLYMAADQAGTFHSRGQVYLRYNPRAFGLQPVKNGNLNLMPLDLLEEQVGGAGKYATLNIADNAEGIVAFTWQNNFVSMAPSATFHTEVPTEMAPLYHVSMKMEDPSVAPEIAFHNPLMKGQQFYLVSSNGLEIAYDEGKSTTAVTPQIENDHFLVYPIPAYDFVFLKAKARLEADSHFYLTDLSGREIVRGTLSPGSEVKIDLTGLAEGTYLIRTADPQGKAFLHKLVKVNP